MYKRKRREMKDIIRSYWKAKRKSNFTHNPSPCLSGKLTGMHDNKHDKRTHKAVLSQKRKKENTLHVAQRFVSNTNKNLTCKKKMGFPPLGLQR